MSTTLEPNTMTQIPRNESFDFVLGKWAIEQSIYDPRTKSWGHYPATTEFVLDLDRTIIMERWEGTVLLPMEGMTLPERRKAISIRSFDAQQAEWNIYWIDSRSRKFIPTSTGNFHAPGQGHFYADLGNGVKSRITWSVTGESSIKWRWCVNHTDGQNGWETLWVMQLSR